MYFSKENRRAILALFCIAVFAIGVLIVTDELRSNQQFDTSSVDDTIYSVSSDISVQSCDLKAFNPNTVDSLTLVSFGLSAKKISNFLHYRNAGARFYNADDMLRTYGWTEDDINLIRDYVITTKKPHTSNNTTKHYKIEDAANNHDFHQSVQDAKYPNKFTSKTKIDVNTADSALLRRIPGIGEKISSSIIRYRTKLGGFYSPDQLLDISIISPELLEWFAVESPASIKKININSASFQTLNSHPYITYDETKRLLQYIRMYGKIKNMEELKSTQIFSSDELQRLQPYIAY